MAIDASPVSDELPMLPAGAAPAQPTIAGQQLQHAADQPPPADDSLPFAPPPSVLATSYSKLPINGVGGAWNQSTHDDGLVARSERRAAGRAALADVVTGNASVLHPEIPALDMPGLGLGVTDPKAWGIVGNMALSRDPVALGRAIKTRLPNAQIGFDETDDSGQPAPGARLTVQVPGGPKMYLDRPGLTSQKGLFYGGQTAAAIASGGRSLPAQMGLGGLQHALSTLGSYEMGGAESPIDPLGTAISALAPGVLSVGGAAALKAYDWLKSDAAPTAAAIADRARALAKWGFAGKEGDITQNPAALATEDLATNAGSDAARAHMGGFHDFNVAQNQTNKRQIIGQISGDLKPGETVPSSYQPNESQFGDTLNANIAGRVKTLTDAEKTAWGKLGDVSPDTAAGRAVSFSPDVSTDVLVNAADTMRRFYGTPQGPKGTYLPEQLQETGKNVVNVFQQLRRTMQSTAEDGSAGGARGFNLGQLQDMRQQLSNVINENQGKPAAAAATQMKRALDDAISAAETTPGRMNGDAGSLADFRAANAATRAKYNFTAPRDNPAAERLIDGVTNEAAPYTGQQTVNSVFGSGGQVTPGGGTNAALSHLKFHLGDEATQPLSGALAMRSLYGNKGTSELAEGTGRPLFDYNSTADRIGGQLLGGGRDVSVRLLSPDAQQTLTSYRDALNVLGTANRAGGPRLNAPGSGYVNMLTTELPFGLGRVIDKARSGAAARSATQTGAEIMQRANAGANTPAELGVSVPRVSTLNDPANPYHSWQSGAWQAGVPLYRGGGLLGQEPFMPPTARSVQP